MNPISYILIFNNINVCLLFDVRITGTVSHTRVNKLLLLLLLLYYYYYQKSGHSEGTDRIKIPVETQFGVNKKQLFRNSLHTIKVL